MKATKRNNTSNNIIITNPFNHSQLQLIKDCLLNRANFNETMIKVYSNPTIELDSGSIQLLKTEIAKHETENKAIEQIIKQIG